MLFLLSVALCCGPPFLTAEGDASPAGHEKDRAEDETTAQRRKGESGSRKTSVLTAGPSMLIAVAAEATTSRVPRAKSTMELMLQSWFSRVTDTPEVAAW